MLHEGMAGLGILRNVEETILTGRQFLQEAGEKCVRVQISLGLVKAGCYINNRRKIYQRFGKEAWRLQGSGF